MLRLLLLLVVVLEVLIVNLLLWSLLLLLWIVEASGRGGIHRWLNLTLKRIEWLSSKLLLLLIHLIVRIGLRLLRLSSSENWMHDRCSSWRDLFLGLK